MFSQHFQQKILSITFLKPNPYKCLKRSHSTPLYLHYSLIIISAYAPFSKKIFRLLGQKPKLCITQIIQGLQEEPEECGDFLAS